MKRHLQQVHSTLRGLGLQTEPLMVAHTSGGVLFLPEMGRSPILTPDRRWDRDSAYTALEIEQDAADHALQMLLELFDHFGWVASADQIRADQMNFFSRQFD
jgi:hypothetical protein